MKMKNKNIVVIVLCIVWCVLLCGCNKQIASLQQAERTTIIKDTTIVLDTIVTIKKDSSLLVLIAECDSANNILLQKLIQTEGGRSKVKYKYIDNYIYIDCVCDSLEIAIEDQKTINKYITERYTEQTKTIEKKDTFIRRLGYCFIGMLLTFVIVIILTLKK